MPGNAILNSREVCTNATLVTTNGVQAYIRNFSTKDYVLYCGCAKKDLGTLGGIKVLKGYAGTLIHGHGTAAYHFGTRHGECNVHLQRYLLKNTEETGNVWVHDMGMLLSGMNQARNGQIRKSCHSFTDGQLAKYESRYDAVIAAGREQNKKQREGLPKKKKRPCWTGWRNIRKTTFFFSMILQSLLALICPRRICKNRQKMAGGFRNEKGSRKK